MKASEMLKMNARSAWNKIYALINWKNRPSTATALGATNLNKMDTAINELDNRVVQLQAEKLDTSVGNLMVSSWEMDMQTYVVTVTLLNGEEKTYDLNLERIPIKTELSPEGILKFTYADGTSDSVNIADLIKQTEYDASEEISFTKEFRENVYHVTAKIKNGSIEERHLNTPLIQDIRNNANIAQTAANDSLTYSRDSKRWAVGDASYEGSETDNSKYYKEQAESAKIAAEQARDEAQASTGTVIMTTERVGVGKPDGVTIVVDPDGTLHGAQKFDGTGYVYVENEEVSEPIAEPMLNADKLGGQTPDFYAKENEVLKKTNLSNIIEDSQEKAATAHVAFEIDKKVDKINEKLINHRIFYRGKNLGTRLTEEQKSHIQDGTFEDLWLGDYWVINDIKWVIVDIDYWYNCGDTAFTSHHLVIMPDEALYSAQMNTTNVTTGGYVGSEMYKSNLEHAKTIVNAAFPGSVLTHREYLCNAIANGRPSGGTWFDSSVELPNEPMMYGHPHFSPTSDGSAVPSIYTISKTQLALFMVCPKFIVNRAYNQWLRDVVSSAVFAYVGNGGIANYDGASNSYGVRPVFPIG